MRKKDNTSGGKLTLSLVQPPCFAGQQKPSESNIFEGCEPLDLAKLLIPDPQTCGLIRVSVEGESISPHISDDDLLIVDLATQPRVADIVLTRRDGARCFREYNPAYEVLAVVLHVIHTMKGGA